MGIKTANCLYCNKPITKGRTDKKFCDPGCKDSFYNAIKSEEQAEISKIEGILKRNRRILKRLYKPKNQEMIIKREALIREGFEFGFHTHIAVTRAKSNEIIFCFDYGYREVKEGAYQLYQSFSKVQVKDGYVIKLN